MSSYDLLSFKGNYTFSYFICLAMAATFSGIFLTLIVQLGASGYCLSGGILLLPSIDKKITLKMQNYCFWFQFIINLGPPAPFFHWTGTITLPPTIRVKSNSLKKYLQLNMDNHPLEYNLLFTFHFWQKWPRVRIFISVSA